MTATRPLIDLLGETRAQIVTRIQRSPQTAPELSEALQISQAAIRRHLAALAGDDLIAGEAVHDGSMGRPRERWTLTARGKRLFADRSSEFADELLDHLEAAHGRTAVLDFLRTRSEAQADRYAERLSGAATPQERAELLAAALSDDGFAARVEETDAGSGAAERNSGGQTGRTLQLVQSHCAIEGIAAEHPEICAHEAALFKRLLGTPAQGVKISRRTTIASGGTACICHIEVPTEPATSTST
ncbi:helix-turn-helix transcriptional regulator [Euzebya tangerina]|uniref:helix-turn-helix transcriptional regulator n=1 Tax=Euzebya tangerina TaxID=591198 RepID=UPI000E31BD8A|nr:ArsR family transcriptional regulator [Euzebya tangerina]